MPSLAVRDIDPEHYKALVEQAEENGRSVSAEVRELMAELARRRRGKRVVADLRALREKYKLQRAPGQDAVSLIRAVRDGE